MNNQLNRQHLWLWLALLIPILAIGFSLLSPSAISVSTITVRSQPMSVTISEEGESKVLGRYEVYAPVSGYLQRIDIEVGIPIDEGELITQLHPLPSQPLDARRRAEAEANIAAATSRVMAAQQQVLAASAEADFATQESLRLQQLKTTDFVSIETLQRAEMEQHRALANLRAAQFSVEVARYQQQAAEAMLHYADHRPQQPIALRSPTQGVILQRLRQSEGVVAAGEHLVTIGDPSMLEVEVELLSHDAVKIREGMRVKLAHWGGDQPLQGVVSFIEPVGFTEVSALGVEEQRVIITVTLTSPAEEWQRLGDGYRVEANFTLWEAADVLVVPESSLFQHQGEWQLFVVEEGYAKLRTVKVGARNGLQAQILNGVEVGSQVILRPDERLTDGAAVKTL